MQASIEMSKCGTLKLLHSNPRISIDRNEEQRKRGIKDCRNVGLYRTRTKIIFHRSSGHNAHTRTTVYHDLLTSHQFPIDSAALLLMRYFFQRHLTRDENLSLTKLSQRKFPSSLEARCVSSIFSLRCIRAKLQNIFLMLHAKSAEFPRRIKLCVIQHSVY